MDETDWCLGSAIILGLILGDGSILYKRIKVQMGLILLAVKNLHLGKPCVNMK